VTGLKLASELAPVCRRGGTGGRSNNNGGSQIDVGFMWSRRGCLPRPRDRSAVPFQPNTYWLPDAVDTGSIMFKPGLWRCRPISACVRLASQARPLN